MILRSDQTTHHLYEHLPKGESLLRLSMKFGCELSHQKYKIILFHLESLSEIINSVDDKLNIDILYSLPHITGDSSLFKDLLNDGKYYIKPFLNHFKNENYKSKDFLYWIDQNEIVFAKNKNISSHIINWRYSKLVKKEDFRKHKIDLFNE